MRARFKEKSIDFGLCLLVTVTLSLNYFGAFVIPPSLTDNILLTVLLGAAVLLLLHVTFFSLRSSLISGAALIVLLVAAGFWVNATDFLGQNHIVWQEKYAYYLLILFCAVLAYACSRSRAGVALLFLTGVISAFFMGVLEYMLLPAALVLFLLGAGILFLRRSFVRPKANAGERRGAGFRYTAASLALCGLALALAAASFVAITVTLHPKHVPLALLTNYTVLEMAAKTGAASPQIVPQADNSAKENINQQNRQNTANPAVSPAPAPSAASTPNDFPAGAMHSSQDVPAKAITYFHKTPWLLIILGSVAAIIALLYLLKYIRRRRQILKIRRAQGGAKARLLYPACLRMLRKIGFKRHQWQTPAEYAAALQKGLRAISFAPVSLSDLTAIYNKVNYGGENPDPAEEEKLKAFEATFWKTCRQKTGWWRYALRYLTF